MKEGQNLRNLSKEELRKYGTKFFMDYDAQKFEYCKQTEAYNHYFHNKSICYPLRKELALDTTRNMQLPKTNLIRQLLLADKSITVAENLYSDDSEEETEAELGSETLSSDALTMNDHNMSFEDEGKSDYNLDNPAPGIQKPVFKLKKGGIRITPYNYQLVLKVIKSLKRVDAPIEVLYFLQKILNNLGSIQFVCSSSSHFEKLKHLFYYKLFRYTGFAFKHAYKELNEESDKLSTPSDRSLPDLDLVISLRKQFEKYITSTVGKAISNVLNDPKKHPGSVGYISGLSCTLRYLDEGTVNSVVNTLKSNNFLSSNNFHEIVPLCISLIENFDDVFTAEEKDDMRNVALENSKKSSSKSKKLYLLLKLLFAKDKKDDAGSTLKLGKAHSKAFLKNKPLAKLFINFFINSYYNASSSEDAASVGRNNLELLLRSLRTRLGDPSDKNQRKTKMINYVYSEILFYDIMKHGYDSFENMNLYSLIYDVFQKSEFKLSETDAPESDERNTLKQVSFFLKIYEKLIPYLSRISPGSIVSSLSLILNNARNSQLFSSSQMLQEHRIVDRLYYCALISCSQEIVDVIFNELEYIAL